MHEAMILEDYLKELEPIQVNQLPENTSWLSRFGYKLNGKKLPSPLWNKDVVVQGTLHDFKFGRELIFMNVLYTDIKDEKGKITRFRKPFCSSKRKDPSRDLYTRILEELKGEKINFVAKTDFITHGFIQIIGEHVYLTLQNRLTLASYAFHMPKSLFCLMIKNRKIEKDIPEWIKDKKEKQEIKEETTEDDSKSDVRLDLEMFG